MSEAAVAAGIPRRAAKPPAAPAWLRAFSALRPSVATEPSRFQRQFEPEPEETLSPSRAAESSLEAAAIDRESEEEFALDRFFAQSRKPEPVRKLSPNSAIPPRAPSPADRRPELASIHPATESGPGPAALPAKSADPMPAVAEPGLPAYPQPHPTVIVRPVQPRVSVNVSLHQETAAAASSPAPGVPAPASVVQVASGVSPTPAPAHSIPAASTRPGALPAYPELVVEPMSTSTSTAAAPAASFEIRERQVRIEPDWPAPRPRVEAAGAAGRKLHIGNLHITVERPAAPQPPPQPAHDPDRPVPFPEPYAKRGFNPWLRRDLDGY